VSEINNNPEEDGIEVRGSELPLDLPEKVMQQTTRYSVPLFLDGGLAGSGTFIKCGGVHGIITAYHVVHNPLVRTKRFDFTSGSTQRLVLGIADVASHFYLEMRHLRCVDVGVPRDDYSGPDLAVIVFPDSDPKLGEIRARKLFYDISLHREERLAEALLDDGLWVIVGNPVRMQKMEPASRGFTSVIDSEGLAALATVSQREDDGTFDFIHLALNDLKAHDFPEHFGGMSGGGVWRIPLLKKKGDPLSRIYPGAEVLAGVVFFQTAVRDDSCEIRCHAAKSVYERVYEKLADQS